MSQYKGIDCQVLSDDGVREEKKITMRRGAETPYHAHGKSTILGTVVVGGVDIEEFYEENRRKIGDSTYLVGEQFVVRPGIIHRVRNSGPDKTILREISMPPLRDTMTEYAEEELIR